MFGYGLGILLLVVGAILKFAVADRVSGVDMPMIGVILMIAGALALILSLIFNAMATNRRRSVVTTQERSVAGDPMVERPVAGERVVEERRTYE